MFCSNITQADGLFCKSGTECAKKIHIEYLARFCVFVLEQ